MHSFIQVWTTRKKLACSEIRNNPKCRHWEHFLTTYTSGESTVLATEIILFLESVLEKVLVKSYVFTKNGRCSKSTDPLYWGENKTYMRKNARIYCQCKENGCKCRRILHDCHVHHSSVVHCLLLLVLSCHMCRLCLSFREVSAFYLLSRLFNWPSALDEGEKAAISYNNQW